MLALAADLTLGGVVGYHYRGTWPWIAGLAVAGGAMAMSSIEFGSSGPRQNWRRAPRNCKPWLPQSERLAHRPATVPAPPAGTRSSPERAARRLHLILNSFEDLNAKVPTGR